MQEAGTTRELKPMRGSRPGNAGDTYAQMRKEAFPVPYSIELQANLNRLMGPHSRGSMPKKTTVDSIDDIARSLRCRQLLAYESWADGKLVQVSQISDDLRKWGCA